MGGHEHKHAFGEDNGTDSESEEFQFNFDFANSKNKFVFYFSGLFLQAYVLALLVSYLHARVNALVYPLTAPEAGTTFTEYIILIKTSLRLGSSLDSRGRVTLQLKGDFADSPRLLLQRGKNIDYFLCRGGVNIFVYHSPSDLGDIVELEIEIYNDTPYEIPSVQWYPSYISVHQPVSRKFWGCPVNAKLFTEDKLTETLQCFDARKDCHGIIKCLLLFHVWLSIFNSPVRLGMYNTLVHVILVFFIKSVLLLCLILVFEVTSDKDALMMGTMTVLGIWILELILEAFIRNTISGFRAMKHSLFNGLVEPSESLYNIDNFALDYNWDNVRPLVVRNTATLVMGSQHPSVYNLFPVPRPYSVYNMWGLLSREKEKEPNLIMRILNECALPMPATMNWLGIEAKGRKEEVLIYHAAEHYAVPVCFFETWLLDWPLAYVEEPLVAGLVISHIMCSDLLMLINTAHPRKRAHLAQLCVHQWHGLICCLFLFLIQYHIEGTKGTCVQLKTFITKTLTQFGKRNPREIKAAWIERKNAKVHYTQQASVMNLMAQRDVGRDSYAADINTSSKTNTNINRSPRVVQDTLVFEDDNPTRDVPEGGMTPTNVFRNRRGRHYPTQPHDEGDNTNNNNYNTNADDDEDARATMEYKVEEGRGSISPYDEFDSDDDDDDEDDYMVEQMKTELMPMAIYEQNYLGPPFYALYAPEPSEKGLFLRYNNEMLTYCCKKKRCVLFRQIHRKVGNKALEVLNTAVQDLLNFSKIPVKTMTNAQVWKRKKMVNKMIEDLKRKARVFDDKDFDVNVQPVHEGFNCNRLLTHIHNHLKLFVETVSVSNTPEKKPPAARPTKRCGFCSKLLEKPETAVNDACHDIERMARFLSKGTIYVSEKELNSQLVSRYSIQNFCAMVLYQARTEALIELEDPPIVMAAHVLQAMIHSMLSSLLPKQTDFHDLSADELRKIGTRLQRIKARYMTSYEEKNRTRDEKSRVEKIKHFLKELGIRWLMSSSSKSLMFTAQLLAECLVQERIIGLSVYSGFVSQDHVILLNGDREKLMEVESKATAAVLKIARTLCEPMVKEAVEHTDQIDVIFTDRTRELNYMVEKLTIAEYIAQPVFLATCTYYIADIITLKIKEFKIITKYLNDWKAVSNVVGSPVPTAKHTFKFNSPIRLITGYIHSDVCSPMLRWGDVVIKGEPPLPQEYVPARFRRNPAGDHLTDMFEDKKPSTTEEKVLAALIGTKRGVDNFTKTEEYDKEKRLQHHLARVQAHLMDQLAEASQAISHTTALDNDFVNEFHQDQLYNVELYASHKLNLPLGTINGVLLLIVMVVVTLLAMFAICIKGSAMHIPELTEKAGLCFVCVILYGFLFQPLKCIIYSLAKTYVD